MKQLRSHSTIPVMAAMATTAAMTSIALLILFGSSCTPDPQLYPDCSAYEGAGGEVFDCVSMDRCTETNVQKLLACCNCDPGLYCGPDLTCNSGPVIPPTPPIRPEQPVQLGARPYYLVDNMEPSELKTVLEQCVDGPFYERTFSMSHRGAPLHYPEHTRESYMAAARMGSDVIECDVTFTADRELVCRTSQCDLHETTNILTIPTLASKCSQPFVPADSGAGTPASAQCCTSDITLAEFKTLCGRMGSVNPDATTPEEYLSDPTDPGTYAICGTVLSHAESIALFQELNVKVAPELTIPSVPMPFEGDYTQELYAQQMINELRIGSINTNRAYIQSSSPDDIAYWAANEPLFAMQSIYVDTRYGDPGFDPNDPLTWSPTMDELAANGVKTIAPPIWMLLTLDSDNQIVPSSYVVAARISGLDIMTWSLESSGPLQDGGGFYYQSIADAIDNDGDVYEVLHILVEDVGIKGIFSDWPATTTYYANCMNLE